MLASFQIVPYHTPCKTKKNESDRERKRAGKERMDTALQDCPPVVVSPFRFAYITMVPSLLAIAGKALPEPLRSVWSWTGIPETVLTCAEEFVPAHVTGRITTTHHRPDVGVRLYGDHVLRCDCLNNPEFWLEIDMEAETAIGRVGGACTPGGNFHVQRMSDTTFRVDHSENMWFWIEIKLIF